MKAQLRKIVYDKCKGHCSYCGISISFKEMQVDHIIPKNEYKMLITRQFRIPKFLLHLTINDVDHIDNLNPACRVCNKWKSTFDFELFRSEISEQIKRVNEYSPNYRMAKRFGLVNETPKPIKFYFENN